MSRATLAKRKMCAGNGTACCSTVEPPASQPRRRVVLALTAIGLYALLAAYAYVYSDRLIFRPPVATYETAMLPLDWIDAEDGARIAVLHLPHESAAYTVLYSHGNGEDLGMVLPALEALREAGFAVLAYDYRGYGLSEGGPPTASGAFLDIEAAYRYAVDTLRIPPARLIVYGYSVGTGPSVHLAAQEPVAALVLDSGFVSAFRVVTGVPLLPFDKFHNLRTIRHVRCPVLVMHGTEDEVIPFSHGKRLYEAAPDPKRALWIPGAGHSSLISTAGTRYRDALRQLVQLIEQKPPSG